MFGASAAAAPAEAAPHGGGGGSSFGFSFVGQSDAPNVPSVLGSGEGGADAAGTAPWMPPGAGGVGAGAPQAFMRREGEDELRELWVKGRRDARAAFKKRSADTARQQRLRARGKVAKRG